MNTSIADASMSAFTVGFFADLALNYLTTTQDWKVGLKGYFKKHGVMESAFIAAAIMYASMWVGFTLHGVVTPQMDQGVFIFVFGLIIDNLFRFGNLMPSLECMYNALSIPTSMFWAGGPLLFALKVI
jgi:hypothetical protein